MDVKEKYTDTQLLRAWDALQDVKMFYRLVDGQKQGVEIAQDIIMQHLNELREAGKNGTVKA